MIFSVDREILIENLKIISRGLPAKSPMPILTGIKMEVTDTDLYMTSSNTDISVQTFINDNLRVTDRLDFENNNESFTGLLDLGEYGNLRKVFNREDEDWTDEIDENKIVCDPFLFRFTLPHGLTEGFIILEKKKGFMVIPVWKKESVPNIDGDIGDSADEQPLTDNTPTVTDNAPESTEAPAEECSCEPENNSDTKEE
jgi:hypothetical protein